MLIKVEDIKTTKQMPSMPPKNVEKRIQSKICFYRENGRFLKPIELERAFILTDISLIWQWQRWAWIWLSMRL